MAREDLDGKENQRLVHLTLGSIKNGAKKRSRTGSSRALGMGEKRDWEESKSSNKLG